MFEWLGLANTREWLMKNRFDEFQHAQSDAAVLFYPIPQVVAKFGMKDGLAADRRPGFQPTMLCQDRTPGVNPRLLRPGVSCRGRGQVQ
jgi:hypothetical protein